MLFGLAPAHKFLPNIAYPSVQESADALLRTFWAIVGAETIHLFKQESTGLDDGSWFDASGTPSTRMPAGHRALLARVIHGGSVGRQPDTTPGVPIAPRLETEDFDVKTAARECSLRMVQSARSAGVSGGITFGMDEVPLRPSSRWQLYLHRGPLPVLQLRIADASGFRPPSGWGEKLLANGAADVAYQGAGGYLGDPHHIWLCLSGSGYLGEAHDIYLLLKSQKIFPWSKGGSSDEAVGAGQRLREICKAVWAHRGSRGKRWQSVSAWRWGQRRFLRSFDRLLVERLKFDDLQGLLTVIGTSAESWYAAGT